MDRDTPVQAPTDEEMLANVINLAFGGEPRRLHDFCREILEVLPTTTSAVLRGSAITGIRWKDGAPFDADGPGTSDSRSRRWSGPTCWSSSPSAASSFRASTAGR